MTVDRLLAQEHYAEHSEKPFFGELVEFITSGSTLALVLEGESAISVVPANHASCDDLQAVFGTRGTAWWCQCQRYKLRPREAFRSFPIEERTRRLHEVERR